MQISKSILNVIILATATICCGTADGASFTGLGDLPGGAYQSFARAVSADGSVVVAPAESPILGISRSAGLRKLASSP